jgi:hypothetical protein
VNNNLRAAHPFQAFRMEYIDLLSLSFPAISAATSIGIQAIMPKTGTSPQQVPQPQSKRDSDHTDLVANAVAEQPPPPGMGKLIDKTV